jgi:flagellar biosynthesis/type III secretory pathway M-ring protein FliF/YscJ
MKRLEPFVVGIGFVGFIYGVNHVLKCFLNKKSTDDEVLTLEHIEEIQPEHNEEIFDQTEYQDGEEHIEEEQEENDQTETKQEILKELVEKKEYLLQLQKQLDTIRSALDDIDF